jgi:hypothetical protein
MKNPALIALSLILISVLACKSGSRSTTNENGSANRSSETARSANTASGVEKVKPAAGTGNVQGKVLFNGKPAENIEVRLCEKFNQFFGGCDGKKYVARTDSGGEYVITNVPPQTYEALTARVFESNFYVFATTGITGLASTKYEVEADKTLFVTPTNLFKSDLKTVSPRAGEKLSADKLELRWAAYPGRSLLQVQHLSRRHDRDIALHQRTRRSDIICRRQASAKRYVSLAGSSIQR